MFDLRGDEGVHLVVVLEAVSERVPDVVQVDPVLALKDGMGWKSGGECETEHVLEGSDVWNGADVCDAEDLWRSVLVDVVLQPVADVDDQILQLVWSVPLHVDCVGVVYTQIPHRII